MQSPGLIDLDQRIHAGMPGHPVLPKTFLQRCHTFVLFHTGMSKRWGRPADGQSTIGSGPRPIPLGGATGLPTRAAALVV